MPVAKSVKKPAKHKGKKERFDLFQKLLFRTGMDTKPSKLRDAMSKAGHPISEATCSRYIEQAREMNADFRSYLARQGFQTKVQEMLVRMDEMNEKSLDLWEHHYANALHASPDVTYAIQVLKEAGLEAEANKITKLAKTASINITIQRLASLEGKIMDRWGAMSMLATGAPLLDAMQGALEGGVDDGT